MSRARKEKIKYIIHPALTQIVMALRVMFKKQIPFKSDPADTNIKTATFVPTFKSAKAWAKLYNHPDPDPKTNEFYYHFSQAIGSIAYYKIFNEIGINVKNLFHLRHEIEIIKPNEIGKKYTMEIKTERLEPRPRKRAVLICSMQVFDSDQQLVSTNREFFTIMNYSSSKKPYLQSENTKDQSEYVVRQRDESKKWKLDQWKKLDVLNVRKWAGFRFAMISNDYNLAHIIPFLQKLLTKQDKQYVQGFYTSNYIRGKLLQQKKLSGKKIKFTTNFTRPVFEKDEYSLLVKDEEFALSNSQGKIVSRGTFSA